MKYLLLLCLLAGGLRAAGQVSPLPVDSTTGKITFQGVVQVPGVSQAELYSRAREWFALNFASGKAVLDMDDRADGKLIGTGYSTFYYAYILTPYTYQLWRTFKVYVRDGRFRYEITDLQEAGPEQLQVSNPQLTHKKPIEKMLGEAAKKSSYLWDKHGQPKGLTRAELDAVNSAAKQDVASLTQAMNSQGKKKDW